jgi:hypothetical protein
MTACGTLDKQSVDCSVEVGVEVSMVVVFKLLNIFLILSISVHYTII